MGDETHIQRDEPACIALKTYATHNSAGINHQELFLSFRGAINHCLRLHLATRVGRLPSSRQGEVSVQYVPVHSSEAGSEGSEKLGERERVRRPPVRTALLHPVIRFASEFHITFSLSRLPRLPSIFLLSASRSSAFLLLFRPYQLIASSFLRTSRVARWSKSLSSLLLPVLITSRAMLYMEK